MQSLTSLLNIPRTRLNCARNPSRSICKSQRIAASRNKRQASPKYLTSHTTHEPIVTISSLASHSTHRSSQPSSLLDSVFDLLNRFSYLLSPPPALPTGLVPTLFDLSIE